jgi:hypothetical protein
VQFPINLPPLIFKILLSVLQCHQTAAPCRLHQGWHQETGGWPGDGQGVQNFSQGQILITCLARLTFITQLTCLTNLFCHTHFKHFCLTCLTHLKDLICLKCLSCLTWRWTRSTEFQSRSDSNDLSYLSNVS